MARVVELRREAGQNAAGITAALNQEGFRPPKNPGSFNKPMIYQLLKRRRLIGNERSHDELLGPNEWWLTDLARELQMNDDDKLRRPGVPAAGSTSARRRFKATASCGRTPLK